MGGGWWIKKASLVLASFCLKVFKIKDIKIKTLDMLMAQSSTNDFFISFLDLLKFLLDLQKICGDLLLFSFYNWNNILPNIQKN